MRPLAAVGPELCGVLVDVCCELRGLEEAEKTRGWPQRAGKVVLQLALTRLARHYGLDGARRGAPPARHSPLGERRLSADTRCLPGFERSVNLGSFLDHRPRVLANPLHHGQETVRTLRRQMLLQM
jgi:Domain of unknown function (DUF6456)